MYGRLFVRWVFFHPSEALKRSITASGNGSLTSRIRLHPALFELEAEKNRSYGLWSRCLSMTGIESPGVFEFRFGGTSLGKTHPPSASSNG